MTYQPGNANVTTGNTEGCAITPNVGDDTRFDISSGTCVIEDWSNPLEKRTKFLSYPGDTAVLPPDGATATFTSIELVPSATDGVAELQMTPDEVFTPESRRLCVPLGAVIHSTPSGVIEAVTTDRQLSFWWLQIMLDMQIARRGVNKDNVITTNGANLSINRGAGLTRQTFFNASISITDPTTVANPAQVLQSFIKQAQAPAGPFVGGFVTVADPANMDISGVVTALGMNKFSNQRIYFFGQSDTMTIPYGQTEYDSLAEAIAGIESENFIEPTNVVTGLWIATITARNTTTSLQAVNDAAITNRNSNI